MALEHALLVALSERPASGLELTQRFERSLGFFWHASYGDRATLTRNLLDVRADHATRLAHYETFERTQFPDPSTLDESGLDRWLVLRGGLRMERFWIDWITDYLHAHEHHAETTEASA